MTVFEAADDRAVREHRGPVCAPPPRRSGWPQGGHIGWVHRSAPVTMSTAVMCRAPFSACSTSAPVVGQQQQALRRAPRCRSAPAAPVTRRAWARDARRSAGAPSPRSRAWPSWPAGSAGRARGASGAAAAAGTGRTISSPTSSERQSASSFGNDWVSVSAPVVLAHDARGPGLDADAGGGAGELQPESVERVAQLGEVHVSRRSWRAARERRRERCRPRRRWKWHQPGQQLVTQLRERQHGERPGRGAQAAQPDVDRQVATLNQAVGEHQHGRAGRQVEQVVGAGHVAAEAEQQVGRRAEDAHPAVRGQQDGRRVARVGPAHPMPRCKRRRGRVRGAALGGHDLGNDSGGGRVEAELLSHFVDSAQHTRSAARRGRRRRCAPSCATDP